MSPDSQNIWIFHILAHCVNNENLNCEGQALLMTTTWHERWRENKTAWDLNGPHPLTRELLELTTKLVPGEPSGKWMIPGCGRAHDVKVLFRAGIKDIVAKDLVPKAIDEARNLYGSSPGLSLICGDVTDVSKSEESTFGGVFDRAMLCALNGELRSKYALAMTSLLKPGGIFASIPFAETGNPASGPPFAISESELRELFKPHFEILHLEPRVSRACDQKILKEWLFLAKKRP
jgi:thiopurine S-methyltransferase